jgi:cyclase
MCKATSIRTIGLLALTGCLWLGMTQQQPPAGLTTEKIADDLFVLVGSGGNVGVYVTDEGVILVDDKFERNVPEILEKVKAITDKPIRYVLNTHHHGDHTGGNATLMGSAEIVAHENARANMVKGSQPGQPRITFSGATSIHLGGKEVRAVHISRGHTNGDAVIYFPARKVIHMGDMFVASAPFVDYASGGSALEWTKTLEGALKFDAETVIPGHGPMMKPADITRWNQSFQTAISRVRALKRQGKSKDDVAKELKLDDLFNFQASAMWGRTLPGLYDEL